jgi:hypothetical protein
MQGGSRQLGFATLILLALAGALALAGPGGERATAELARGSSGESGLDRRELLRLSLSSTPGVARRIERVRELRFDRIPRPEVVTSRFLNRLGLRELGRADALAGIAADDAVGRITGLLARDERLEAAYGATGDLAAAAYDPRTDRLYVVSDAVVANRALVEFVLAHELDHALEDQRFGLPSADDLDDDGALAETALIEGSATAAMTDYAAVNLDALDLLAATEGIDEGTGDVPEAYVDQLTWAYLGGMRFVNALRALAGGWKLVDYALSSRPPATTEQVLHPQKYVHDELPSGVRLDPEPLRAAGWRPADRGAFGELPTAQLLELGAQREAARAAAAGWDGDRYELWRRETAPAECSYPCREDLALVAKWAFDADADEREFERAARDYLRLGLGAEPGGAAVWAVEGGYAALAGGDRETAVVFAPTARLARETAAAQVNTRPGTITR